MKKHKLCTFILLIVITIILILGFNKPPIHDATYSRLLQIDDIGEEIAEDIVLYVLHNPSCTIEDLDDIKYIGEYRIKQIKKSFR